MLDEILVEFCTYFKRIDEFIYDSEEYGEYVAFCLISGSFFYRIDGEREQLLSAGEVVICPPKKRFFRKINKSIELCMIKFNVSEEPDFCGKSIAVCDITRLESDMKKLENCIYCFDMEKYPVFSHYCRDIIYLVADSYAGNSVLAECHKIITDKFDSDISIEILAKKAGYSTVHFINLFKKIYGCTPKKYLADIRMQKAKELLLNTDKSSKEIAYLCGFHDELYFIRYFKKYNDLTPTGYRRIKSVRP